MSSITIRNLDPTLKERLRFRAAKNGHSMEAEARQILGSALGGPRRTPDPHLYARLPACFAASVGCDLAIPRLEPRSGTRPFQR